MRYMIRLFSLCFLLSALALLVSGCQSLSPAPATATPLPTPTTPPPTPTLTPADPINLSFRCRCDRNGINPNMAIWLEDVVFPDFAAHTTAQGHPISLTLQSFDGSDEELRARYIEEATNNTGPDILTIDGFWIPGLADAGLLKPLNEVVGAEVEEWEGWQHISEGLQNLLGYQGNVYGLALGTDVRSIYYREDLFDQAGIKRPWQPQSWEELLDTARTLKTALPAVTPLQINAGTAMGEATTMQGYLMLLLGAGSHIYDFSQQKWIVKSPAILDTLMLYQTIYRDELLGDPALQLAPDGREQSFQAFHDGRLAIIVEGDFLWRSVLAPGSALAIENRDEIVRWAKMPAISAGKGYRGTDFVTISGGTGVVINPNTQHPAAAWEFMSYMFSRNVLLKLQAREPRMRVRTDVPVTGDATMTAMSQVLLPLTTVRPTRPEYASVSVEAQLMTERVITGEMTPQEAMDAYAEAVTAIVGPENTIELPTSTP